MSVHDINGSVITAFDADGNTLPDVYDIDGNRIGPGDVPAPVFLDTAALTALPSINVSGNKQGACTDGEYIYQSAGDAATHTYMRIVKYKIADGSYTYVQYDGTPNFGHANDMTYNPNNAYLYVATMLADGSVIVLDSADLSYVDIVHVKNGSGNPYSVWQMCFDRLSNRFLISNGKSSICVYDESFRFMSQIDIPAHLDATGQGCETDGYYFYRITYNPSYIDVVKLSDGTRVKTITNPISGEPETLLNDWNGHFYINQYNASKAIFYAAQIFET